jgi:hypothetical protein
VSAIGVLLTTASQLSEQKQDIEESYKHIMKMKSRLIALAVVCLVIPATVVAQSRNEHFPGTYVLMIQVHNMAIPAVSICKEDGTFQEFDYQPVPSGGRTQLLVAEGNWLSNGNRQFKIASKTALPNNGSQQVRGMVTLSASGNDLTGTANVELLNQDGTIAYSGPATVSGHKVATSKFTARR